MASQTLTCGYCGRAARFRETSEHIYQGLDWGPVWECPVCDAYCGCHPDTGQPLGTLANKALRTQRREVKLLFNPLWEDVDGAYPYVAPGGRPRLRRIMRTRAYAWLAEQLGLSKDDCHVAMFDEAMCRRVVQLLQEQQQTAGRIRTWAKERELTGHAS